MNKSESRGMTGNVAEGSREKRLARWRLVVLDTLLLWIALAAVSCTRQQSQNHMGSRPSDIKVEVRTGGPVVVTTSTSEFQLLPSGFVQASLLKDGAKLTLDDPAVGSAAGSDHLIHGGKELHFISDFGQAKVLEAIGRLGRGKRVEIPGRPLAPSGIDLQRLVEIEAYDDFPNILLVSVAYKNVGASD